MSDCLTVVSELPEPPELPLIAIVGPTASGKTAAGIELARRLNGEIVSADAVAVYRGLDVGSAKPTGEERAAVPFHLIDVADPDEGFTLADFERLANDAIAAIRERGRTPILVGGTGLYVRAVTATLTIPNVPPQIEMREELWADVEKNGSPQLHERLASVDGPSAAKILPGDAKRIIRALEVYAVTGRPMSDFHTPEGVQGVPRPNTFLYGLRWDRELLYRRIENRVDNMMAGGFVEEVVQLQSMGYGATLKSMQSLGYRHVCDFLDGRNTLAAAVEELKRDTRRFAKRQISWFKADSRVREIGIESEPMAEAVADYIVEDLRSLDTTLSSVDGKKEA